MSKSTLSACRPLLFGSFAAICLTSTVFADAGAPGSTPNQTSSPIPWYQEKLLGMEVGPTGAQMGYSDPTDPRYCARFDGREIVRHCVAAHAEYLVIWARDGDYAYYDSKFLTKCPGLGSRDVLREAVDEARQHHLPLIAYCVMQQGGNYLAAHPEYAMRDAQGNTLAGLYCFNSGYLEDLKRMAVEQLAYGIDGFHFDMFVEGFGPPYGCWCDSCLKKFQAEYGKPMSRSMTWDADWEQVMEFRYRSIQRFEQELYAYVKSINPHATVDFNYHGNPPFSWETGQRPVQHAGNADFVTGETGAWFLYPLSVSLNTEFYRAVTPGRPVQVAMSRDVRMYHNQTTRPVNDLRWELFTALAHGAFATMVDKTAFDGGLDPVAYERIGEAFADVLACRRNFGQPPVHEVGIYYSSRTRDWYGREKPAKYYASFAGAHKAMVYEHIPWSVLLDENVTLERLQAFPVVLLSNAGCLTDRETALLRQYVEQGGRLIVTGFSGTLDRFGQPRDESALADLIGARLKGRLDTLDNWVRFPAASASTLTADLAPGVRRDWPFLVKGPAVIYAATTAEPVGELMKPFRTIRQQQGKESTDWPMSAEAPVGPAILVNHVGKGIVLTFAGSPDFATASENRTVEARRLLRDAVRWLDPKPRVQITAPNTVETVVTDDPATRTLRVHLMGYNAPPQTITPKDNPLSMQGFVLAEVIEDAPMYRATVELDRPFERVEAWRKSTQLTRSGQRVEATINDIHDVLIFHY
ncbi:MAG: hypothetical protein PHE83_13025 [Opitutaceae bacterium]|nr:hypothetical protein [Opitutaceae bacterium]